MIYRDHRKHLFYTAFAAMLATIMLAASDRIVRSEPAAETTPSPFKFKPPNVPTPKKDVPNITSAPTSVGALYAKGTIDFSSSEYAYAIAAQTDGKIVAAGTALVVGSNNPSNYDFAVFRYNTDGSLDTSFDADGKVTTPISDEFNNYDSAYAVAVQPDGKIIAAGSSTLGTLGYAAAALVRYNTDGSLDVSFGTGGKVLTSGYSAIIEIALQSDGKIVVAGDYAHFKVARYNGDGSLDVSFGTGGIVGTDFSINSGAYSVALQADGKIVAAGEASACDIDNNCFSYFALARYNTNGSLDTSFNTDGKLLTSFAQYASAYAIVVQTDGRIVAAGAAATCDIDNNCDYYSALARYNGNGSLDTSFDVDGKVTLPAGDYGSAGSIALQSNGKIVLSGTTSAVGTGVDFSLFRLNIDGSPDISFDGDGKLTTDFGNDDYSSDVAIQSDGRIVVAGSVGKYNESGYDGTFDFALSRYNADGSLDAAFDGDGKLTTSLTIVSSVANAVFIEERPGFAEPATFLVGYSSNGGNDDFAISMSGNYRVGRIITSVGNADDRANAAAIDPSGRIVATGYSHNGSDRDFALVRYFQTLGIDTSFDEDGRLTTDFGGNDEAKAVAVQTDGKIVVVGQTTAGGGAALIIARYNDNGSLDASFGTGGRVIVQAVQNARAMAIQPDGKIIAAGSVNGNFAIARLNPNGSLDTSFDGDGIAITIFELISQINSVALQPYGKIVAAGFIFNFDKNFTAFALTRHNSDGSLDTSFDADGKVTTWIDASSAATAVRVQRNGKIVAAGSSFSNSGLDFALARYNQNGSLDTTFDTDGRQTTDFFGSNDDAFAATIDRYGSIISAGSVWRDGKTDFAMARYRGDTPRKVAYDFDDDGLAELSVFRPSNGVWYLNRSTLGFYATQLGGSSNDRIAPADFDGDGRTDVAVFRDSLWYLRTSRFNSNSDVHFGLPDDIPLPADYDGDGFADIAIYRGGAWWMRNSRSGQVSVVQFGLPDDKPVPADYDGDGIADQAVYRNGEWHINGSSQGYTVIRFGLPDDKPVPADYDGDAKADLAVYRDGTWYLLQSTNGFIAFQWGLPSDVPAPADYDGDGKTDAAVFRDGTWYLLQSRGGISIQQFGLAGDKPVPAAY
jgi:uncharacterized delta-60 repeat protein